MDQYKAKQLKFEDYLSFFHDHRAEMLTCSQLNQILSMHGFVKLTNHIKEDAMNAVYSLNLAIPTRSTINNSICCPTPPLSLEEMKRAIREIEWEECPIGSVVSFKPMGYCAASASLSLGVSSELVEIRKKEKKAEKEKIHDSNAGGVTKPLPVKKIVHVPVISKEHDGYTWRGNGTKKKAGVAYRWYYRCRMKSCPVRKTVATDINDSSMCNITYIGEHDHEIPCQ
ncbi:WRKY family transcription factor [Rhynchospora pubera]|uniref:WRKY family transcription factor n=1 Tax=Rhynchospora pubera TaxID=906938 RepID=A0AAV8EHF3_9POAL|nr:WRKY family transcription factor [Rhynchospora pubera]